MGALARLLLLLLLGAQYKSIKHLQVEPFVDAVVVVAVVGKCFPHTFACGPMTARQSNVGRFVSVWYGISYIIGTLDEHDYNHQQK